MPSNAVTPYHVRPQSASVLLGSIADGLGDLEARLSHYVDRIPMPESDRRVVAEAREIVARAHGQIAALQRHDRQEKHND